MVTLDDLKKIYLLQTLPDESLEKMIPFIEYQQFDDREVVFEEGEKAETFYMLKRGKLLLEVEISEIIIISLGSIKSGYSFGWSALIPDATYTSYAICSEPSEVFSIPGMKLLEILDGDHTMGYQVMTGVVRILKHRLERRTGQFLKVMSKHPDIQKLLGL